MDGPLNGGKITSGFQWRKHAKNEIMGRRNNYMTTENIVPEVQNEEMAGSTGCLGQVGWFLSGAVLPMASLSYYRKAAQKSVGSAILFFVFFTVILSTLSTISLAVGMFSIVGEIKQSFEDGTIPEITIRNGVAEVEGKQPYIMVNEADADGNRMFLGIDTTGQIISIDESYYYQGFLLTRTELHMLTPRNGYQVVPLSDLNAAFEKDPILINGQTMSQAWGVMTTILVIVAFIFLVLWHTVVRLMFIAMIALIFWGIVTLIKPNTGFGPIIITGLYALVPAIYASHLLSRSDLTFPGLQTLLFLIFWVIGLVVNLVDVPFFNGERPPRLFTALIGLPMLFLFILDIFWQFPSPYDLVSLWVVAILTVFVLTAVRLFFRFQDQKSLPTSSPVP
jgi:hypothetical protein